MLPMVKMPNINMPVIKKGNNAPVIPLLGGLPSSAPDRCQPDSLLGSLGSWQHIHKHATARLFLEGYLAFDKCKQGVVLAHANIIAGVNLGSALAHDDVAGENRFAAKLLHAKTATG